jgi:hypothetical protein
MPPSPKSEWNHFGALTFFAPRRFVPLSCVPPMTTLLVGSSATPWNCVIAMLVFIEVHENPRSPDRQMPPSFPS